MTGEELTIAGLLIRQLSPQRLEVNNESIDAFAGEGEEKVRSIQARQLSGTLLGDPSTRVPVDRRRKPDLVRQLMR